MSYTTRVTGAFELDPPISWEEIKDSPFKHAHQPGAGSTAVWRAPGVDLDLYVDMAERDIEGGVAYQYSGTKLVMRQIDEYRAHSLEDQVRRVVGMFGPRKYEGKLEGEGESGGWDLEVWRITIADGRVSKTYASLIYPEEITGVKREILRQAADELVDLPEDGQLDPGRVDSAMRLRAKADNL